MTQSDVSSSTQLNPAQKDVLFQLGARPSERPDFGDGLKAKLKSKLEEVAQSLVDGLPDTESLFVNKHLLTQLMGCEAKYVAESQENFEWSIPTAYEGYEKVAKDPDVDIVYCGTITPLHKEHVIMCLEAGKHVVVEKPMSMSVEESEACVPIAQLAPPLR